jgi:hypothetical protein
MQTKPKLTQSAKRPPAIPTPMRKELGSPRKRNCVSTDVDSAVPIIPATTLHPNTHRRSSPRLRGKAKTENEFVPIQVNDAEMMDIL